MNKYNEKETIYRLQDPETRRDAFGEVVRAYSEQLYWQIRRMVFSHEDANDLLQNTFMKAWDNLDYFRGEAKLSTWLYRIAINECINFLNRQRAERQLSIDDEEAALVNKLESDPYFDGDKSHHDSARKAADRIQPKVLSGNEVRADSRNSWNQHRGAQGLLFPCGEENRRIF